MLNVPRRGWLGSDLADELSTYLPRDERGDRPISEVPWADSEKHRVDRLGSCESHDLPRRATTPDVTGNRNVLADKAHFRLQLFIEALS